MKSEPKYHIGFSQTDLGDPWPTLALLSGDPDRAKRIAYETAGVGCVKPLSENRGLNSYLITLPTGQPIISATSGMGAPSLSIVVRELFDVGIRQIIRIGTCGSIQKDIPVGSIVISRAALCRQGAANDIAPPEYPAAANPFLTVALVDAAQTLAIDWHIGITASVDTFYEGQERTTSLPQRHLLRWLVGSTKEYRHLNILNYEMEVGTLFKMAGVYGFAAACVCAVVADRTTREEIAHETKKQAEANAINVAIHAVQHLNPTILHPKYWR